VAGYLSGGRTTLVALFRCGGPLDFDTAGTGKSADSAGTATGRAGTATGRAGTATGRAGTATGRTGTATGRTGAPAGSNRRTSVPSSRSSRLNRSTSGPNRNSSGPNRSGNGLSAWQRGSEHWESSWMSSSVGCVPRTMNTRVCGAWNASYVYLRRDDPTLGAPASSPALCGFLATLGVYRLKPPATVPDNGYSFPLR